MCFVGLPGVITLEDVLEEVIQDEIVDESDQYETNEQSKRVERRGGKDSHDFALARFFLACVWLTLFVR